MCRVERVQHCLPIQSDKLQDHPRATDLEVQFPDIVKEGPNSIIVLGLMQQYEFHV
jgi:hypothetical protein